MTAAPRPAPRSTDVTLAQVLAMAEGKTGACHAEAGSTGSGTTRGKDLKHAQTRNSTSVH